MPLQDFLAGTAFFAVMLCAVGVATALVVRRRLRHLDGLERALAAIVVGTTVLIAVHLVPLMLTILARGTVLAACAVAIGLAALVRPVTGVAAAREPAPEPVAPSSTQVWLLAGGAAAFAALAALADLARWAGDELVGVDPLTFHLPNVARWIQTGSVWQIDQFVPLLAHGDYPHNGDVVLLSTVLPWHNDFLVRLPITFFLATAAVAVYAVARELRAPAGRAVSSPPRRRSRCRSSGSRRSRARCRTRSCGRRTAAACCSSCATRAARGARTSCSPASRSGSPAGRSGTA